MEEIKKIPTSIEEGCRFLFMNKKRNVKWIIRKEGSRMIMRKIGTIEERNWKLTDFTRFNNFDAWNVFILEDRDKLEDCLLIMDI